MECCGCITRAGPCIVHGCTMQIVVSICFCREGMKVKSYNKMYPYWTLSGWWVVTSQQENLGFPARSSWRPFYVEFAQSSVQKHAGSGWSQPLNCPLPWVHALWWWPVQNVSLTPIKAQGRLNNGQIIDHLVEEKFSNITKMTCVVVMWPEIRHILRYCFFFFSPTQLSAPGDSPVVSPAMLHRAGKSMN